MMHVMRYALHSCYSCKHMSGFMSFDWIKGCCTVDSGASADGFHTMNHYELWRLHDTR